MRSETDTFHDGERAVQLAAGERETAARNGAMIAPAIVPGARAFLLAQRMLVIARRDGESHDPGAAGSPRATVVFGEPGFASAYNARALRIDLKRLHPSALDAFWQNASIGEALGVLAIELATRRRLRVNGRVADRSENHLTIGVDEAFPNCPKYIQRRTVESWGPGDEAVSETVEHGPVEIFAGPTPQLLAAIASADTAFVASGHAQRGLDVSHRGGSAGFIRPFGPGVFRIPDYTGNGLFNTLGNLSIDPRCGITILDFYHRRQYQMTGTASLHITPMPSDGTIDPTGGRYWDFRLHAYRAAGLPDRIDWSPPEASPFKP